MTMKNSLHTPGPWSFSTSPQPNGCPSVGARGLLVAVVAHSVNQSDQKETALANARLIAAAPELLKELTYFLDWIEQGDYEESFLNSARAAIAKATGESA